MALLRSVPLGRLVYTEYGLPQIWPVNFAVTGGHLTVWQGPDVTHGTVDGQVVAFAADEIDPGTRAGWRVVVVGQAESVPDPDEPMDAVVPVQRPWTSGPFENAIRIPITRITGHRVRLGEPGDAGGQR